MTDLPTTQNGQTAVLSSLDPTEVLTRPVPRGAESAAAGSGPVPTPDAGIIGSNRNPVQRMALVVIVGIGALALAFVVMLLVGVSTASINALAVFATPVASMVAAYYGITLSIQQVRIERSEKVNAILRADAAIASSREAEVWAAQMESGLRVAMVKLAAARVGTDEVTKAAGTPDDFF